MITLTITPTAEFVLINDEVPARIWVGTTSGGVPVWVFVSGLQVPEGWDFTEFDAALIEVPAVEVVEVPPSEPGRG